MQRHFSAIISVSLAAALCALAASRACAADDSASEVRTVDARITRVRLDGIIELKLRQGPKPELVISGERRWLSKTVTEQRGDTLVIDTEAKEIRLSNRDRGVHAELTLPQLREVVSNSLGWTDIAGFSGDQLVLSLEGAGSMRVVANYRVLSATLGGLGSMNIQGGMSEGIDLNLRGAGYVTLAGNARWLKANLGGLGGLDAQQFQVDVVKLDMGGLGNAAVYARHTATLSLNGLGSVTVHGKPATRQASVNGLGKVTWK